MARGKDLTGIWAVRPGGDVASSNVNARPSINAIPPSPVTINSAPELATRLATDSANVSASNTSTARVVRSRERRHLTQLNVLLPVELVEEIKGIAHKQRRTLADVVEQAAHDFVASQASVYAPPSVYSNVSMMTDDVAEKTLNIINRQYAELVGKPLNANDRLAVAEFVRKCGPVDVATARAGIAMGLVRTKQRQINSVRYFFNTIEEVLEMPEQGRAAYAEHCVRKLGQKLAGI